ncbi:MAG: hypothetical protein FJ009_13815 [Chloroflexi bacterium]|nr:hypothetical protein [Chloroflexota bacterium]
MTTIEEITGLMRGLSAENLARVRAFVASLREAHAAAWSFDFLEHFAEATRAGMEVKVADATCANVTRPALWEHPPMRGSATVGYLVPIPAGARQVTLKFAIGIRDGAELPPDRFIAFRVLVNGWKLWSAVKTTRAWEEHAVEMPQLSSDLARIEFITDSLGDNRWNWAVWAEPRLESEEQ